MTLAPLLSSEAPIPLHAAAAIAAVVLGAVQLAAPKGTRAHRGLGRIWVGLMVVVALSSFWIHGFRLWGPFSPIHLLSLLTLGLIAHAIRAARRGDIREHANTLRWTYALALVVTGAFTLLPGRAMHQVIFGGAS